MKKKTVGKKVFKKKEVRSGSRIFLNPRKRGNLPRYPHPKKAGYEKSF